LSFLGYKPASFVHFVSSSEASVRWVGEADVGNGEYRDPRSLAVGLTRKAGRVAGNTRGDGRRALRRAADVDAVGRASGRAGVCCGPWCQARRCGHFSVSCGRDTGRVPCARRRHLRHSHALSLGRRRTHRDRLRHRRRPRGGAILVAGRRDSGGALQGRPWDGRFPLGPRDECDHAGKRAECRARDAQGRGGLARHPRRVHRRDGHRQHGARRALDELPTARRVC
jgi:hypothetical protein